MVTKERKERLAQRERMLYLQDDRCFICRRTYQLKYMTLDHDHALEREGLGFHARGVLCSRCNRALGMLGGETDQAIEQAIIYLERIRALRKEVRSNGKR